MLLRIRKLLFRNGRENGGNGLVIAAILMYHIFKRHIHPDHMPFIIQNGIGDFKLLQQYLLNLSILRGKADHLIQDHRLIIKLHGQYKRKVYQNKAGKKQPCRYTQQINHQIN